MDRTFALDVFLYQQTLANQHLLTMFRCRDETYTVTTNYYVAL